MLLFGDMFIFSVIFVTFSHYRSAELAEFVQSSQSLNRDLGLLNTILLLTSSLAVALAVRRVRQGLGGASALFSGAMLCGGSFVVVKVYEYWEKVGQGITPTKNMFFTLYFAMTGIHLFHVLIGLAVLAYLVNVSRRVPPSGEANISVIEGGGCFWHLVDLLWIVLFALLYLLG